MSKAALLEIADRVEKAPLRCPWNPFPHNSEWGKRIDREYARARAEMEPSDAR